MLVVDGGPTMNPSTYELLAGIHAADAHEVLVLPNSPNVILAAEKAAGLSDKPARVVPTTAPAGGPRGAARVRPEPSAARTTPRAVADAAAHAAAWAGSPRRPATTCRGASAPATRSATWAASSWPGAIRRRRSRTILERLGADAELVTCLAGGEPAARPRRRRGARARRRRARVPRGRPAGLVVAARSGVAGEPVAGWRSWAVDAHPLRSHRRADPGGAPRRRAALAAAAEPAAPSRSRCRARPARRSPGSASRPSATCSSTCRTPTATAATCGSRASSGWGRRPPSPSTVRSVTVKPMRDRRRKRVEARVVDESGPLVAVWFNQPWIARQLGEGAAVLLHGKLRRRGELWVTEHELLGGGRGARPHGRARARPSRHRGHQRRAAAPARLGRVPAPSTTRSSRCPAACGRASGSASGPAALSAAHFPDREEDERDARRRLAFEELFLLQLAVAGRRRSRREGRRARPLARARRGGRPLALVAAVRADRRPGARDRARSTPTSPASARCSGS